MLNFMLLILFEYITVFINFQFCSFRLYKNAEYSIIKNLPFLILYFIYWEKMSNENLNENENLDDEIVPIEPQDENQDGIEVQDELNAETDADISFEDLGLDEPTLAAVEKI